MKIDNKGVTIVEIIVSITLISIVLIFLLRLLISLRDLDDKSLSMIKYEEKTALIVNAVQNEIKDKKCDYFSKTSTSITMKCGITYTLTITGTGNKTISFNGSKTWTFPTDKISVSNADGEFKSISPYFKATINVTDDKGNIYPIEISHYNT